MSNQISISVCIPYKCRPDQLRKTLLGLSMQQNKYLSEIVLGLPAGEKHQIASLIKGLPYIPKIRFAEVVGQWSIGKARNAAMKSAKGQIILLLDCDIILEPHVITEHLSWHLTKPARRRTILLGGVFGYDKLRNKPKESLTVSETNCLVPDRREGIAIDKAPIPWCMCWTGHLSLRADDLREVDEWFDEDFIGWGMEDQEWAFRLINEGFKLNLNCSLRGIHIPHKRDVKKNLSEEEKNLRRFLLKHPCFEVEMVATFGDMRSHELYNYIYSEIGKSKKYNYKNFSVVDNYQTRTGKILYIGVPNETIMQNSVILDPLIREKSVCVPDGVIWYPLLGMKTPFDNRYFDTACVSDIYQNLEKFVLAAVGVEAKRIANCVRGPV